MILLIKMAQDTKMFVNELLAYITHSHRSGSKQFLRNIVKHKFNEIDIKHSKQLIWQLGKHKLGTCKGRSN